MVENNDTEYAPCWSFVGIEADPAYMEIASARIAHWEAPDPAARTKTSKAA